jgi:ATP-dependent exoDNAse (exonuclease V) beta subunit
LKLPEYDLETFTEICQKLLSRKYDKDHETVQEIVRHVWDHTRDVREAIAIAKIVDTPNEVSGIAQILEKYS